jgi:hypothetical protein
MEPKAAEVAVKNLAAGSPAEPARAAFGAQRGTAVPSALGGTAGRIAQPEAGR